MNKRKVTKGKGSKVKPNNHPSEVFVLPPNLLEALGINLGNIETAPECSSGNQISEKDLIYKENSANPGTSSNISPENELPIIETAGQNLFSKEKFISQDTLSSVPENIFTSSSNNESSIIHTANLMKASVFLSPTFISNSRGIIEGEVEILGSDKFMVNDISARDICSREEYDQDDYMIGGLKFPNQHQDDFAVSNLVNTNDAISSLAVQETNRGIRLTDDDDHVEINKLSKNLKFDDHGCNVANVEINNKPDGSVLPTDNNKKINIISEQILDPTQLKSLQSYSDKKNCLIPVTMNTVLKSSFRNSACYQNGINNHCDSSVDTYYVEPCVIDESCLPDMNERKPELGNYSDPSLNNESFTENHNFPAADSLVSHMSSNVSKDIIFDRQMQEGSSRRALKGHEIDYTHVVLAGALNSKKKINMMETVNYDSNIISTSYVEEITETLQNGDSNALYTQKKYSNRNYLSSKSENVTVNTQIQEVSSQHESEGFKNMIDVTVGLTDTFNYEYSVKAVETNTSSVKSTDKFKEKFDKEKLNEDLQKVNSNSLDEQTLCIDSYKLSSENEHISITTKQQECSSSQAFEMYEKELDSQIVLPQTPDFGNSDNRPITKLLDTKTSDKMKTNCEEPWRKPMSSRGRLFLDNEEQKISESPKMINSSAIDDKHQKLTKTVSDNVNRKVTKIKENCIQTLSNEKRESITLIVKDSKNVHFSKDHLSQTNEKQTKLNVTVKPIQVKKKILKRFRPKKTYLGIKKVRVQAETKSTEIYSEKLCDSCVTPGNNTEIIQYSNKYLSSSTANDSIQLGTPVTNEIEDDRIKEIAGYLRKIAELQTRKKTFKEKQNISDIKIFSKKKHAANTKLSIQGVEKPGGLERWCDLKTDKNIKTYERKNKNKSTVEVIWNTPNLEMATQKIDVLTNTSFNTCKETDFCLCEDFGRLKYYDKESLYEHIHFWNIKQANCTPDLVFSIYNENIRIEINNDDDTKKLQECSSITMESFCELDHEICWNQINFSDSEGCNARGREHVHILLDVNKPNESSVDEQIKPDASKSSGSPAKNIKNWHKKDMESLSLLQNCQGTVKNDIVSDLNPTGKGKKRKYSSTFDGSDKPPVNQNVTESELETLVKSEKVVKKQKCLAREVTEKVDPGDHPDSKGNSAISLNRDKWTICGVCQQNVKDTNWLKHIASQHNYLSWRADEEPLDFKNRELLIQHLTTLVKQYGVLSCNRCGITRKYAKPFLQHINQCGTVQEYQPTPEFDSKSTPLDHSSSSVHHACVDEQPETCLLVECGVCRKSIPNKEWYSHIESQHNYLAWKNGEKTLDVDDDGDVKEHLNKILKERGRLKCAKCGLNRKYVKSYLCHIKSCDGQNESLNENSKGFLQIISNMDAVRYVDDPVNNISIDMGTELAADDFLTCGVCGKLIHIKAWNNHIGSQHNYLAWKHGEAALDVDDDVAVKEHLYNIMKECGGLKCAKCGLIRKYVKSYQNHIRDCDELSESTRDCATNSSLHVSEMESAQNVTDLISTISIENEVDTTTDVTQCAVCGDSMHHSKWYNHIGSQHNYLAWRCGDPTLDLDDEEAVHKYLHAITKEYGGLKCVKCGLNRKYVKSYLNHVKTCTGISDSQTDCTVNESLNVSDVEPANIIRKSTFESEERSVLIRCGVCEQIVQKNNWYNHIESKHNYLAWKYGEPALDIDNEEAVREHLNNITKEYGSLNCTKCGITRKYVKSYLTHVKNCREVGTKADNPIADDANPNIVVLSEAEQPTGLTKCGVCGQYMPLTDWMAHIEGNHNYLAWKDGEPPLNTDDEIELQEHLFNILKQIGALICVKCGARKRFIESYLQHIRICDASEESPNSSKGIDGDIIWPAAGADHDKCGECNELVHANDWVNHIAKQHNYLAKKVGETPLDINDDEEVFVHLYNIVKVNGSLNCQKCGLKRKYVKSYLEHVRKCSQGECAAGDSTLETNTSRDASDSLVDFYSGGICGVCDEKVETGKWIQHIQKAHNYLAWRKGEKPWDLDNYTEVNDHLYEISKKMDGLTCNKCGLVRKYVKTYLTHIKSCNVVDFNLAAMVPDGVGPVSDDAYRCAMCQKEIKPSQWKNHAMKEHYNITWVIGETPIDIKNPYAVEKYLKEYKQSNSLTCNNCGATRTSFAGFYAHIITCGKSEEQIEMFRSVCDICNNKYLCIYKNQHMMIHRVQTYNKEIKQSNEKMTLIEPGKRRAAEKARSVIETYSSNMSQHKHKCSTCGFGTDFKEELQSHKCDQNEKDFNEEESSASEREGSEDESADSEVDSDISREEEEQLQALRAKRYKDHASVGSRLSKIHFEVDDPNHFIEQSDIDFCKAFFTDETLFPKWISSKREMVSKNDFPKYLPPMEQSCKVNAGFDWTTLTRFEAKRGDGTCIFVGGSIVCITWIPLRVEDMSDGQNFLAIACHNDVDCPRYEYNETMQHENLIQIWDFGTRNELPQIVYGIAHDFGTVWSMDWCPSGARDVLPEELTDGRPYRLGLLAVACSNGSAYIFSVPQPSTVVKNDNFIQKLKPVAELRMKMLSERSERKVYQATSITWSKEKGHEVILVGYADGSTGYYDINNESPLSWRVEDEVDIFFPYSEERPHNTCITATDMVPRLDGDFVSCSASPTGAEMSIPGAGVRVRSQLPTTAAIFAPHWPATLLAGDIVIMGTAVNELEWTQPGRKMGGMRALAGCARCGRVAAASPPVLRVMRPHPAYPEFRKPIFGLIEMIPLANKRSKQVNDELAMKIEPLTYSEAIIKYGLQFQSVNKRDKVIQKKHASKPKAHFPERFPLADIVSMAFCPAKRHHHRLAVATHSGMVFITNVHF